MKPVINRILLAVIAGILSGCIVATVTKVASFDPIATDNYSQWSEQAHKAEVLDSRCIRPCYRLGASTVFFFPSVRATNVKAAGPIVPIIPVPGKGYDYGDLLFYIAMRIRPGSSSLLTMNPTEHLASFQGVENTLSPIVVEDCSGNTVNKTELHVYGAEQCFRFFYDINRGAVEKFTLMPANVEADGDLYAFPDIDWVRGSYNSWN